MSTQSVIHNTDDKIGKQLNNFFKKASEDYLLKERFSVGKGINLDDIAIINRFQRIFCEKSCEISEKDMINVKEYINKLLINNIQEL